MRTIKINVVKITMLKILFIIYELVKQGLEHHHQVLYVIKERKKIIECGNKTFPSF